MDPPIAKPRRLDDIQQRIERLRDEHVALYLESHAARERAQSATHAARAGRRRRWQGRYDAAAARYGRLLDETDLFAD